MRLVLVVNNFAASVTTRRQRRAAGALAEVAEVRVCHTSHRGHATELAGQAAMDGADAVVVLGGDGTLNEVAGALVGTNCALGALPGGSTSVFARTIGLPRDTVAAAEALGSCLIDGSIRRVGLGEAKGRLFALHVGVGWDAALVEAMERHPNSKRYFGQLPFVSSALRTFFGGYDRTQPHFSVHFEDGEMIDSGYFSLVLNSDPYTYVGPRPFTLSPEADLDSGLSVVTLTSMNFGDFVPTVASALRGGGLRENDHVHIRTGVESVTIRRRTTMPYQMDGDFMGDVADLHFTHRPRVLRLLAPTVSR